MRIECPKFKRDDGTEAYVVIGFVEYFGSQFGWCIEDVMHKMPPKRKYISLSSKISNEYSYRHMDRDGRKNEFEKRATDFCGEEEIKKTYEYAWNFIKPPALEK